jgi:uncharacterized protein YjbJ (UPF0337 family)
MATEDRIDATLKNVEGKVQEAAGEVTGDPKQKAEGQAKQVEAEVQHTKENVKEEVDKRLN